MTIKDFQLSGFPLTISRVCKLAFQYAKINGITRFSDESQTVGRKWLSGFLKPNPGICVRKAQNLSIAHAMGVNPMVIGNWFKLLAAVKQKCQITSLSQIWEVKVVGAKNIRTFQQVASEQGETSTILTFINACGDVVPPMVIHNAARVQGSWKVKAPGNVTVSATSKGYITKSRFHEYGLCFIHYLKSNGMAYRPNLLIIDGHKSHIYNLSFYEVMHDNNVEILTIPPNTSHLLQALDSVPFAQFKKLWEYHLIHYNNAHSGCSLTKPEFWEVFSPAWNSAMVPKNIISGFGKPGIYPHNPEAMAMAPSQITD